MDSLPRRRGGERPRLGVLERRDMSDTIREILQEASNDPELLQLLKEEPAAVAEEFDLGEEQLAALKRSDLLLEMQPENPLLDVTTHTMGTITITGSVDFPTRLEDLRKEELIRVVERAVVDEAYAERLREFREL